MMNPVLAELQIPLRDECKFDACLEGPYKGKGKVSPTLTSSSLLFVLAHRRCCDGTSELILRHRDGENNEQGSGHATASEGKRPPPASISAAESPLGGRGRSPPAAHGSPSSHGRVLFLGAADELLDSYTEEIEELAPEGMWLQPDDCCNGPTWVATEFNSLAFMFLGRGWKSSPLAQDLQEGHVLHSKFNGAATFSVKAFGNVGGRMD
ncbi:hypothetical protein D1007_61659 [Hordeum vulgare]|nr:hypothetical protein D1007_61659 [Hordeum vulgare]